MQAVARKEQYEMLSLTPPSPSLPPSLPPLVQVTCLQFSGNRIVSGSDDNTLRVWNAITGKVRAYGTASCYECPTAYSDWIAERMLSCSNAEYCATCM